MKTYQILLTLVCSLIFLSLTNYILFNSLQTETKPVTLDLESESEEATNATGQPSDETQTTEHFPLTPEDPAKYGIITVSETHEPESQIAWDAQVKAVLVDSKILETKEGKIAIEKMQTSHKKFNDTKEKMEKQIKDFEKELESKPNDAYVKHRLQTLYKLKAIGKILEDKVVTLPDPEGDISGPKPPPPKSAQTQSNKSAEPVKTK